MRGVVIMWVGVLLLELRLVPECRDPDRGCLPVSDNHFIHVAWYTCAVVPLFGIGFLSAAEKRRAGDEREAAHRARPRPVATTCTRCVFRPLARAVIVCRVPSAWMRRTHTRSPERSLGHRPRQSVQLCEFNTYKKTTHTPGSGQQTQPSTRHNRTNKSPSCSHPTFDRVAKKQRRARRRAQARTSSDGRALPCAGGLEAS